MKAKQLLTKAFYPAALAGLLFTSSAALAQVKIGAAPNVIAPNVNLDVQSTNGNRTVVLKDNGFVGIGTVAPTNLLTLGPGVGGNVTAAGGKKLAVYQAATGDDFYGLGVNAGVLQFHAASLPDEAPAMVLTGAGSVGIGTTAPISKLHVHQAAEPGFGSTVAAFGRADNKLLFFETSATAGAYNGLVNQGDAHIIFSPDGDPYAAAETGLVIAPWSTSPTSPGLKIMESGNVGVNVANPVAPLHVGLTKSINSTANYLYFNVQSGTLMTTPAGAQPISVYAAGSIVSGNAFMATNGVITSSDARIKDVMGRSNSSRDLAVLRAIEITDYVLKDKVRFGNKPVKKVIAQQLETVYPMAVNTNSDFIPNIYAKALAVTAKGQTVTLTLATNPDLKKGDKVRLYTKNNEEVYTDVIDVAGNSFTAHIDKPESEYFVFGKKVDDFRAVDYDAIAMLNVSATQELARQVEELKAKNQALQGKVAVIDELKAENEARKEQSDKLEAKLTRIEKVMGLFSEEDRAAIVQK
ncbi:MAG TPA: hypothetical protein VGN64_14890 [Dyadobacter sp.]|jgi:FtsZ-binding cell division protein ZapB|nr:hypothetical protein [Dyadobacter sp.]